MAQAGVDSFLDAYPELIRSLASELIALISGEMPEAAVSVKPGWQCVAFTHPQVGYAVGVFPKESEVRVGFEFGALLDDAEGLLVEGGSQLRYAVVKLGDSVPAEALSDLIRQAVSLPPESSVRRMMVRERNAQRP